MSRARPSSARNGSPKCSILAAAGRETHPGVRHRRRAGLRRHDQRSRPFAGLGLGAGRSRAVEAGRHGYPHARCAQAWCGTGSPGVPCVPRPLELTGVRSCFKDAHPRQACDNRIDAVADCDLPARESGEHWGPTKRSCSPSESERLPLRSGHRQVSPAHRRRQVREGKRAFKISSIKEVRLRVAGKATHG